MQSIATEHHLSYHRLRQQAQRLIRLRWFGLVGGMAVLISTALLLPMALWATVTLAILCLLVGGVNAVMQTRLAGLDANPPPGRVSEALARLHRLILLHTTLDLLAIGLLIHFTGGLYSPNRLLLLVYLAAVATLLPRRTLISLTAGVLVAYTALSVAYLSGVLPIPVIEPQLIGAEASVPIGSRWASLIYFDVMIILAVDLSHRLAEEITTLLQRLAAHYRFLEELHWMTGTGVLLTNPQALYRTVVNLLPRLLECRHAFLVRWEAEQASLTTLAHTDAPPLPPNPAWERLPQAAHRYADRPFSLAEAGFPPEMTTPFPPASVIAMPIRLPERRQSAEFLLTVFPPNEEITTERHQRFRAVTHALRILMEHSALYTELQERAHMLDRLVSMYVQIEEQALDIHGICLYAVTLVQELFRPSQAMVYLYNPQTRIVTSHSGQERKQEVPPEQVSRLIEAALEQIELEPVFHIQRADTAPDALRRLLDVLESQAITMLNLSTQTELTGVLLICHSMPRSLTPSERSVLQLMDAYLRVAFQNAHLHYLMAQQSLRDDLTGLPNRRALRQRISMEINRSRRSGHPLAMLMLDLDGFKQVNDTFGHQMGDRVLQNVGQMLQRQLRSTDFVARYGGDEFTVLLPETDLQGASRTAHKLREAVLRLPATLPAPIPLGFSVGIALFPHHAENETTLLQVADRALYYAKQHARGQTVVPSPDGQGFRAEA